MITTCFPHGQFARWSVSVGAARRLDGDMPHFFVMLSDPTYRLSGIMTVRPGEDAYDAVWAADWDGGNRNGRMEDALDAVIEQARTWLDANDERVPEHLRPVWRDVVEQADHSRAEFHACYPDGTEPAFEVVHVLAYDAATGELVAA